MEISLHLSEKRTKRVETKVITVSFRLLGLLRIMGTEFRLKNITFDVNLVEAARAQRQFLQMVDEHPCLYGGLHVENAVRRYACKYCVHLRAVSNCLS